MNKNRGFLLLFALFSAILASVSSVADDLAGVMSVDAGTNGVVEFEMPFASMEPIGPQGYVSGIFSGDGGEYSDRLFKYDSVSGLLTNAVWGGYSWFDPATGLHSFMSASPGDIFYFFRIDDEPFRFSVFGRLPSSFTSSSSPRFTSIGVNPTNETVNLAVSSDDRTFDVFSAESTNAASALSSEWTHLFRAPSAKFPALFSDSAPISGKTKLFLASDALRDSDDDGLSDSMESYVYGTSPVNPDSDGDGLLDGQEIAWGLNPLIREIKSPSLWYEGFELPLVAPGSLSGQNGWTLSGDIEAVVTEQNSFKGNSSLSIRGSVSSSSVDHDVTVDSDIVWIDMQLRYFFGKSGNSEMDSLSTVKFFATPQGYLVASDGAAMRTNNVPCVNDEEWNRFTLKLDYHTRRWDIYVNGVIVLSNLHLFGDAKRISGISFEDGSGDADEIRVLNYRPLGLSSDGDPMPDEWELSSFGNLLRDGFGDFDGDGLSDAREFAAKTNPLLSDSDSDGIPDNWEVERGLDPLDAADVALDPDGDGMSNQLEYELGLDPWFFEPNPREVKSGLYAEFFHTRGEMLIVPDVSKLELLQTSIAKTISYCDGTWPDKVEEKGDLFAARFSGFVKIAKSGTYNFYVTSDDGFQLSIGGKKIIQDIEPHSARETASSVFLEKGWQPIELLYYENKQAAVLSLSWSGQGIPKALIPADCLCHIPPPPQAPPAGFSPGLVCSLYSLPGEITRMSDFSAVMPTQTSVVEDIDIPATILSWPMAPETMTNRFAAIFEGAIYASGCGRYVFSLSSDDGSRLFIDGKLLIDNDGNHSMTEKTATIALSAGLHDIRVEYYENEGEAGLKLSWGKEGESVDVIHSGRFFHQSGIVDTDSDGMPDWWEEMYDLNSVNPDDAAYDLDGDGVVNLQEYINGTNPRSPDTDSDAMPDGWEISNGLCPFANDAIADADNDGLVNAEEYIAGSDPVADDTDRDGLSDYDESSQLGTNPNSVDLIHKESLIPSVLTGTSSRFTVLDPKSFMVTAGILNEWRDYGRNKRSIAVSNRIIFNVDGHFVAYKDIPFALSNVVETVFYTPVLPVGEHEITIEWYNPDFRARAELVWLNLNEISGVDFEQVVRERNLVSDVVSSKVSPVFVEGKSRFPWLVTADDIPVRQCGADSWYMDVSLGEETDIILPVRFEGLVTTNLTVTWESTNLFEDQDDIRIRRGSSFLFAGFPSERHSGTVEVYTNGVLACSYAENNSISLTFLDEGKFTVYGVWKSQSQEEIVRSNGFIVDSVGGAFPLDSPACQIEHPRTWSCPNLSDDLFYSFDVHTHFSLTADGMATLLVDDTRGERFIAARLFEGGPVLDVAFIKPMWAVDSFGNSAYLIESSGDYDRCRCYMRQYGAAEKVRFRIQSYTSSVLLDDFSTERWITPGMFDKDGIAWFELVKTKNMSSPCHTVTIYQDGEMIGEAVYGNVPLPKELK